MVARRARAFLLAGILPASLVLPASLFATGRAEESQPSRRVLRAPSSPVNDYDVAPRSSRRARPDYPKAAYEKGIEGTVHLEILIDEKGRVAQARVTKSIPELDGAALACVTKWRFVPAQKEGRPVAALAVVTVTFKRAGKPEETVAQREWSRPTSCT
jgi:periplasmic protein TonB